MSGAPGATTDLDIYLVINNMVVAGATTANIGGDAVEVFGFQNPNAVPVHASFLITRTAGPRPTMIKYILSRGGGVTFDEFATNSGSIRGHQNAASTEAVGAAFYYQTPAFGVSPPLLAPSSAAGTTPILFTITGMPTLDPRADKPEIVAPTGENTTFFGSDIPDPGDASDTDTFPNFFGTSAAAPHAAGVAALMHQVSPSSSPATIYSTLESTATDMGTPGFDNDSGFGLIQAAAAVCTLVPCRGSTAPALSWPALGATLVGLAAIGWWRVNRARATRA